MNRRDENGQSGFTIIEVSIAALISMVGLVCVAGLFTLSISQNKVVRQFASTTALAQEKLEQLTALERNDTRLAVGGNLNAAATVGTIVYSDDIHIGDTGQVYLNAAIPAGLRPQYRRYWSVQTIPALANSIVIGVRVVALQIGRNTGRAEETTLTTVRTW